MPWDRTVLTLTIGAIVYYVCVVPRMRTLLPIDTCEVLMKDGALAQPSIEATVWQPDGCDLQLYSQNDSKNCLRKMKSRKNRHQNVNVVFTGDSRIRQLRDAFLRQLSGIDRDWLANRNITCVPAKHYKHADEEILIKDSGVRVSFNWAGVLDNGTGETGRSLERMIRNMRRNDRVADLLVLGNGVWTIRDCARKNRSQADCLIEYRTMFLSLLPKLNTIARRTTVVWAPQIRVNQSRLSDREFTNSNMRMYNEAIESALASQADSKVIYWNSLERLSYELDDSLDGLHFGPTAKYYATQMLMNLLCNRLASFTESGSNSCCPMIRAGKRQ
ncbi:putative CAS1 domain-containing protein 1 [Hypsibius exemplaris]|uniref:CAS1 domain-containing protein 1 n=1 Tax=Hypsibius exemplaris TaxID=2072580 RepID=A0A1W0W8E0_HYPEX|nr:putative CAS1 domain-containing protein 1 [Hypsibius exemplaris]